MLITTAYEGEILTNLAHRVKVGTALDRVSALVFSPPLTIIDDFLV
jgi:hypothetical protein